MLHRYAIYRTHRRWVRRYRLAKTRLEEEFSISGSVIRTAAGAGENRVRCGAHRSEEHTSELQSLMRISYAVFCLKKKKKTSSTQKSKRTHHYKKRQTNTLIKDQ